MSDQEHTNTDISEKESNETERTKQSSGCPFHNDTSETKDASRDPDNDGTAKPGLAGRAVNRRSFMRTALAIGGTAALTAVTGAQPGAAVKGEGDRFDVPQGPKNPNAFPERQHAWAQDLKTDPFGNGVLPNHQLILFLNYTGGGTPTEKERKEVEAAFRTLEMAFQRLTGGDPDADNDGLVFMVGYSRSYFDRFDASFPKSIDLLRPETVLSRTNDDPGKADNYDSVVLLSSDTVPVLLGSEAALFGNLDTLNGVSVRGTLAGVYEKAERRTAFVGKGLPRENLVEDADAPLTNDSPNQITNENVGKNLNENAPLSMGYKSGFKDNLATEDAVTIPTGPFKEGTTFQVSKLELDLGKWYGQDRAKRDKLMFSHDHSPEKIGEIGEDLEDDSEITEEIVNEVEQTAKEEGLVGHAAKTAQARDEDFEPLILRRSEGVNNSLVHPDEGTVGFNFSAVMEDIEDFVKTRQAMNASHLDDHIEEDNHGILPYMEVTNRATFLIPPRKRRSLPRALPNP